MDATRNVFLFSGQGSQSQGMMAELYATDHAFREELDRLDRYATMLTGGSVMRAFLRRDGAAELERLQCSHPAIFMVQVALARRLMDGGVRPTYVFGASLGELVALVVSGVLAPRDGLRLVIQHARAIERSCPPGGMLAVLAEPSMFDSERALFEGTWLAAEHFSRHFVVSGAPGPLSRVASLLRTRRIACQRLPVGFAFHSPLVAAADAELTESAQSAVWRDPQCGFVSCAAGDVLDAPSPRSAADITTGPIRFATALRKLESRGPFRYLDLGPSGTMATFAKYALPASSASSVRAVVPLGKGDAASLHRVVTEFGPVATRLVG